ncbi:hypothetical protein H3146_10270 [Streptomyces sp. OF3]|uniref:PPE domain-containing protein n=1 Tax=Streptomyces alkaliterrae TaxID=2213162 RepID=A0A7W3ZMQ0_9ACTN|nr:hypothetical protein [Streptomyces alkaliterrae]MBB1253750.1 hypothetical protein [Streptomyces alkaliterrae]
MEKHTTKFAMKDLAELKAMLAGANPKQVQSVADNWKWVHDALVGGESGGLKAEFDKAIDEVLQHWSGSAAREFRKRAKKISDNIAAAGPYAKNVSNSMSRVAQVLTQGVEQLNHVKPPSSTDRGLDKAGNVGLQIITLGQKGGRDDTKANNEIAAGKPTADVLRDNATELSEGRERALEAAMVLEYVGGGYRTYAKAMGSPNRNKRDDLYPRPDDNSGSIPPVLPVPVGPSGKPKSVNPSAMPSGNKGAGYTSANPMAVPRPEGITGGVGGGSAARAGGVQGPGSQVGTGLNGVTPNALSGASGLGGPGGSAGVGGGGTGAASGVVGTPGAPGGVSGGARGAGGGRGAGRMGGMPGMGGAGAGAGAGGRGAGKGGSGRGALAKQRGGVVGAAGRGAASAQGGSGLHRSRGGSKTVKPGSGRGAGMMGAPGARGAAGKEEKERKERPDYLVEDEETWTPKRDVAPKVIE